MPKYLLLILNPFSQVNRKTYHILLTFTLAVIAFGVVKNVPAEPAFDPTLIETPEQTDREKQEAQEKANRAEREKREEEERKAREAAEKEAQQTQAAKDYWISINPGFMVSNAIVRIKGKGGRAEMIAKNSFTSPDWMLDIKSPDYRISEHFGIHMLLHTRRFDLKYQRYETEVPDTSEDGGSTDTTVEEDLGTRLRGYYTLTVPVLYYSLDGGDKGLRLGFGYGPSFVQMQGSAQLDNGASYAPLFVSPDRDTMVQNLQITALALGSINFTEGDPIFGSLLLGLRDPGGLERMGLYMAARGDLGLDLTTVFLIQYLSSDQPPGDLKLTVLEALGAVSLANVNINFKESYAPSFFLFGEYAWDYLTLRIALGGPRIRRDGFRYNMTNAIISVSIPINI